MHRIIKLILTHLFLTSLTIIAGAYFIFMYNYCRNIRKSEVIKRVEITISDSASMRFVDAASVRNLYDEEFGSPIGKNMHSLNIKETERYLASRSAIKDAQVCVTSDGTMKVVLSQRRPVLRIESEEGGFYVDETAFIFPLQSTFTKNVPVVSGYLPVTINNAHRGFIYDDEEGWMKGLVSLATIIDKDPFWNALIEQVYVNEKGDIELYTQVGQTKFIIGDCHSIDSKLARLMTFYKKIAPKYGWDRYSAVDLKYNNQIVCVLNK